VSGTKRQLDWLRWRHIAFIILYILFGLLLLATVFSGDKGWQFLNVNCLLWPQTWSKELTEIVVRLAPSLCSPILMGSWWFLSNRKETEKGFHDCLIAIGVLSLLIRGMWRANAGFLVASFFLDAAIVLDILASRTNNRAQEEKEGKKATPTLWHCVTHRKTSKACYITPQWKDCKEGFKAIKAEGEGWVYPYFEGLFLSFICLYTYKIKGLKLDKLVRTAKECYLQYRSYWKEKEREPEDKQALANAFISFAREHKDEAAVYSFFVDFFECNTKSAANELIAFFDFCLNMCEQDATVSEFFVGLYSRLETLDGDPLLLAGKADLIEKTLRKRGSKNAE